MPTAHDYYTKHSRKVSSSQMSLPDQLKDATDEHASRSITFLPATTYSKPGNEPSKQSETPNSPDSFYRQYQNVYTQPAGTSLRQGALRTGDLESTNTHDNGRSGSSLTDRRAAFQNGVLTSGQEAIRPHVSSPGLRSRKSSVKNLVNQINASANEVLPPVPPNTVSRNGSRNVSPVIASDAQFQQSNIPRPFFGSANLKGHGPQETAMSNSRPLFGEVVTASSRISTAGYGIQTLRIRSGSEGSSLPSPNFMTSPSTEPAPRQEHNAGSITDNGYTLSSAVYTVASNQPHHRRANSEVPLTPTRIHTDTTSHKLQYLSDQSRNHGTASRIPVSVRRGDNDLDVGRRSPSSANSKSLPIRRPLSPPQIQSPGQRGKKSAANHGPKSPSLRANIIIPPPKVSPQLRSSRPRLPVSTASTAASTAASRAKMAEKFNALQRMNDEKRQVARRGGRPPELTDFDLKERRLRITQALSRSLEGQDLKGNASPKKRRGFSRSRTASPALSDRSHGAPRSRSRNGVPAVVVDTATTNGNASADYTPVEGVLQQERSFSQTALDAMQGTAITMSPDQSSPREGFPHLHYLNRPAPLQTNFQRADHSNEPSSAVTEGTMIDPEPQEEFERPLTGHSVLDQINHLRSQNAIRDSEYDMFSDRGDQESVQIVLRNTTYLDDDEAIRKGYRPARQFSDPVSREADVEDEQGGSWLASLNDSDQDRDAGFARLSNDVEQVSPEDGSHSPLDYRRIIHRDPNASARTTMASDTYTIVNIVLQQHSTSGIVDQEFVDDVYQRVLENSPYLDENSLSADRIEQICLREIQDREDAWYKHVSDGETISEQSTRQEEDAETPTKSGVESGGRGDQNSWLLPRPGNIGLEPPPFLRGHRYKSSLDSAEDWADTSPSVSDWMRFAANDEAQRSAAQQPTSPLDLYDNGTKLAGQSSNEDFLQAADSSEDNKEDPDLYSAPPPRAASTTALGQSSEMIDATEEGSFGSAIIHRPQIPRRITSVSQIDRDTPRGRQSPTISVPSLSKVSTEEAITPEQRRLRQRRNVIKELVDTEFTYEKDLRVLCDIYKQTASAALGDDDIRVLFGNVEQVQVFSKEFLMLLKQFAKPTYAMERQDRKKERTPEKLDSSVRPKSSSSTLASIKANDNDPATAERDRETQIGQAFDGSLANMEKVYTEYIRNRHAANLRLEAIQKSHSAREWLKECKENSSDITNAWNLDALLVKPVQRITKYPLLLKELIDSTPDDHPDVQPLRKAFSDVTEVNVRINDVKKHTELVDQVLNRKRKDSDVRAGISKAFGRRAEKLKQHVGITELYEDAKFNEIKIHYDNNIVQLMVVGNDCNSYGRAITKWVNKMVEIAAAAEAWVDVGHSNHQEAESRLRQFAMVVRGISTIALPDHLEQLNHKVLTPMQQAVDLMTKFKTDPKGILQKREKRMIDYAQIKSKKDKGEKVDRKMIERMEQSEALNVEAKERMRKLITATASLVQACQINLVQMQIAWQGMIRIKLSAAMGISLEHLDVEDIAKEWQLDFDFQEASALSLGICNGSLLAEAVNMVNFQTSSTTLNGEESPRQASFTSLSKRSISQASENSYPPLPDYDPRTSGTYGHQYHEHMIPYANPRGRAQSAASSKFVRTPDLSQHGSAGEGFSNYVRYDTGAPTPRLSVETPSLIMGLQPEASSRRPVSSSTFFSASGTPPPTQHQSTGSSIFSSAMPMSDSPVVERLSEPFVAADPEVLFTAASVYEFNIDRSRREAGFPYLTYVTGEIFDIIGERGELWLARNQDDPQRQIGWIWNKHFAKLAG